MSLLEGRVALITGAGRGVGRGHAFELARHGAKVVVNDLGTTVNGEGRGRAAQEVVDRIVARGGAAVADFGDVSDEDEANAMVDRAIAEFGRLDILVNNAGIVRDEPIEQMSVENFDAVWRVHVRGTWLTCRAAARYWRERAEAEGSVRGRIINTTSGSGLWGYAGETNYTAAKSAITGMTMTLSLELGEIGVTANAISPGGSTRMQAAVSGRDADDIDFDQLDDDVFRLDDPRHSSPVVAWLASEESSYVTGQVIRAVAGDIVLLRGWELDPSRAASSGGKRWNAAELGAVFGSEIFHCRAPGALGNHRRLPGVVAK